MKNILNLSTDRFNGSIKRQPSIKTAKLMKLGIAGNSFQTEHKSGNIHSRVKTEQYIPHHTTSTISIYTDPKLKIPAQRVVLDRDRPSKKIRSEMDLKKVESYHTLSNSHNIKLYSTCKPSYNEKQIKNNHQSCVARSLQKLRQDITYTNPEILAHQLRSIGQNDRKNGIEGSVLNQWYLLSSKLIDTIKIMKKKQSVEIGEQRQCYKKRENKLMKKLMKMEIKNQRYTTLINRLRMRNIDIDSIWHEQKLNTRVTQLLQPQFQ